MPRRSHPKQEIEDALRYAESHGWRVEVGGSHAWVRFIALTMIKNVVVEILYCQHLEYPKKCG
jgi:hypothetical protein